MIQRARAHPDYSRTGTQCRFFYLLKLKNFRTAMGVDADRFHFSGLSVTACVFEAGNGALRPPPASPESSAASSG